MSGPRLTGNRCECTACGEHFNSISTFDRHRIGDSQSLNRSRCMSSEELILRGWSRSRLGFWIERAMRSDCAVLNPKGRKCRSFSTNQRGATSSARRASK